MKFINIFQPSFYKGILYNKLISVIKENKPPHMIFGYTSPTGEYFPKTRISDTVLFYKPENIKISDNVYIGHYSYLDGTKNITIGEGTQIGPWVGIFTHSSHNAIRYYGSHYHDVPEELKKGYETGEVKIGEYVFIAPGSKINPGVTIGNGSIISSNSVVKKNVPPFSIVEGNNNKIVGDTKKLDRFNLNYINDPQLKQWYEEWQKIDEG